MKEFNLKIIYLIFFVGFEMVTISCTNNKQVDAKEASVELDRTKLDEMSYENDKQFLINAAEIHREEISLGQLAQVKANSPCVKELGKMMELSHTKSLSSIVNLANKREISLPESQTDVGDKAYKKLKAAMGIDFDKAYTNLMVISHKDAISIFENTSGESLDNDIRSVALASLPGLKAHLALSISCQYESDKM